MKALLDHGYSQDAVSEAFQDFPAKRMIWSVFVHCAGFRCIQIAQDCDQQTVISLIFVVFHAAPPLLPGFQMYLFTLICFKFFLIKTIFEQISFRTFWIELCKSCKIKLYDIIAAIIDFPLTYNFS